MSSNQYASLIDQWCAATGMQPWAPEAVQHVEVNGAAVALAHDEQASPGYLHVYVDLGVFDSPEIVGQVMRQNMIIDPCGGGYFAMNPKSGSVVYRQGLLIESVGDGAGLSQLIHEVAEVGRHRLHGALDATNHAGQQP